MESAAALAKELGRWNEVSDFYRRASELYRECGRLQPASDALAKGASKLRNATMTAQRFKPSSVAIRNRCAMKLLSAYEEGDAEEIKRIGQSSAFNHLDHVVIRKLPTGDVQAIKKAADDGEESLDEDDLT
ncbi:hypothetical protein HU200_013770 [Digitaria exilis]|uniref:Gamma-soluble NSF attachment protein n=1 Tax=Digitaria exilis TaxID=1010633 RepID=A0A835FDP0_9POAL|nr:hypothetical protein HU200_013770 [Digitaria exilis]